MSKDLKRLNVESSPFRVLHVIDSLKVGGAQTFLLDLLTSLNKRSANRCHVAPLYGPGPLQPRFERRGIPVHNLARHRGSPAMVPRLKQLIAEERFDIVHAHLVPSCLVLEAFRGYLGVEKCVMHVHTVAYNHPTNRYQNVLERFLYRRCDLLLGCSNAVLKNCPDSTRKEVLYNGVDFEKLCERSTNEDVRTKLGIAANAFVVGMVGRLIPQKNPRLILKAAAELRQHIPNLRVLFVGDGVERSHLESQAATLGLAQTVIFAGTRMNVFDYLKAMDVFVLSSNLEGMPVALVEAMFAGVCPVVSSFEAATEVVTHEKTGRCFERGNEQALVQSLRQLHDDPEKRQHMAHAAHEEAVARFSIDITARRLESLYASIG